MLSGFALVALVIVFVIVFLAARRPDSFRIERSATINASPERLFSLIAEFHLWEGWSPWAKLDPAMKTSYSGATSGVGAIYEWEGNAQVGKGRMEVTAAVPASRITIKLDFFKPFTAHNTAEFRLVATGRATTVSWAMVGPSPFMSKLMGLFFNMDRIVGKQFEDGLRQLALIAEG